MRKDKQINLRVRREQLQKIKELGFRYSDCWELGFERICENERSELEKMREKYHNLYIHVNTKLKNFGKKLDKEHSEIERLYNWYKKQNRSISNPSDQDRQALLFQMKKRDIHTFTVDQVFDYWKDYIKD